MFQTPFNECEIPFTRNENEELIIHEDSTNHTFFHNILPTHIFTLLGYLVVKIIHSHTKSYLLGNIP